MSPADYENELKQRDETIARLEAEIRELKKLLSDKAESKASKKPKMGIHFPQVTTICSIGGWKTILERLWNLSRGFARKRLV